MKFSLSNLKWRPLFQIAQNFVAECIGTAVLVFIQCLASNSGAGVDSIGVALACGFAVFAGAQIASHVSGGHVNPAVTVLCLFFKKCPWHLAIINIIGQIIGGIIGFGLVKALTPWETLSQVVDTSKMCVTIPNSDLSLAQAFFIELFSTSVLLLVICTFWDTRNIGSETPTIKIGFTIMALAYGTGHLTGCSLNPARSFGPALWNSEWHDLWIYIAAPILAAGLCGSIYKLFFDPIKWKKKEVDRDESIES